ncbi:MAG: hypothetical protein OHK0046_41470 [Anaerolineae bacterium]
MLDHHGIVNIQNSTFYIQSSISLRFNNRGEGRNPAGGERTQRNQTAFEEIAAFHDYFCPNLY